MPAGLRDDQQFGEFGLSNDEGASRKRASLAADFAAQVEAKRARLAAHEAAEREAVAYDAEQDDAAQNDAAQEIADRADAQPSDAEQPSGDEQSTPAIEERVFSERVAYGDVRHMSKNFYKGLIASIVVVIVIVIAIVILGRTSL
jgi:flagellar biosynthesis GTPase FlhF